MTPEKKCTKCGEVFPATEENFRKHKASKYGLDNRCKSCARKQNRLWTEANLEKKRELDRYRSKNNKAKKSALAKKYYAVNREKLLTHALSYYKDNKASRIEYAKRYRDANVELRRVYDHRRRALERSLPTGFADADWQRALVYFNGCCAVCERPLNDLFGTHKASMDHWIALSKGGGTTADNIVPLCHGVDGCNNSKHNNTPIEWLTRKFGKRHATQILKRIEAYFDWIKEQDQSTSP